MPGPTYEVSHLAPAIARERRVVRRDVDEFIGLCRGFAADGTIEDSELRALDDWIKRTKRLATMPLVGEICVLAKRASLNPLDVGARDLLRQSIGKLTGEVRLNGRLESTSLPLTQPIPVLEFQSKTYCFTGTFQRCRRAKCEQITVALGGNTRAAMAQMVDYLVIGATATGSWLHSSYGRKIQDAVHWRKTGLSSVAIVSEKEWVQAVEGIMPDAFD